MEDLIQELGSCIRVYIGTETLADPYEKNKEKTYLPPIYIRGIVSDLIASQITWKLPGISVSRAKELTVNRENRTLIEKSQKIEVQENGSWIAFEGWKEKGRMQIREEGNYIRLYIYSN